MKTSDSQLFSEILEQPQAIEKLLKNESTNVQAIARKLRGKFKYIVIAARGTSDNAARYAAYLLGAHNHLQVALATPSLFTFYKEVPDMDGALVIGISQSGQSPDIVEVLAEAHRQGRPTLAITNDPSSPLAQTVDDLIPLQTGIEKAVAATKTYTSSLAAIAMLSCMLNENTRHYEELVRLPDVLQSIFTSLESNLQRVERYRYMEHCAVIGRGFNYCSAFEIALKIKELNRIVAEPYSSADFRHGPVATIHPGFPVILIIPQGSVYQDMADQINELRELKAELIIISDHSETLRNANLPLPIPQGLPEWLTPLAAVIPGQLFAMKLTIEKGLDPDHPFGLKKVTETY